MKNLIITLSIALVSLAGAPSHASTTDADCLQNSISDIKRSELGNYVTQLSELNLHISSRNLDTVTDIDFSEYSSDDILDMKKYTKRVIKYLQEISEDSGWDAYVSEHGILGPKDILKEAVNNVTFGSSAKMVRKSENLMNNYMKFLSKF